ncbi:hypothetical protein QQ045_014760 [Rhodiola kirilowii]
MGLRRDRGYCYAEAKPCTEWVLVYFKDCLCNLKDEVSFGLGLLSVTCWALAEIPQIVTNFKAKSSQGVSLMLLLTWILGLPTQFYTALLYTVGSLILVGQVIYYDYITMWFKKSGRKDYQVAGYGTFIAAAANLPNQTGALNRLVLQKNLLNEDQSGPYGQIMGWGMAVIYISGRVPQILLNMRGNVEGLSPLMFIFALMGNTTYILSILVRSSKWVDVKANMPFGSY